MHRIARRVQVEEVEALMGLEASEFVVAKRVDLLAASVSVQPSSCRPWAVHNCFAVPHSEVQLSAWSAEDMIRLQATPVHKQRLPQSSCTADNQEVLE